MLKWSDENDNKWLDRGGVSILIYAVTMMDLKLVTTLLDFLDTNVSNQKERFSMLLSRLPRDGFVQFGIPGLTNALHVAMCYTEPNIVAGTFKFRSGSSHSILIHNSIANINSIIG